LSLANELIAYQCSRYGVGEEGMVMLSDVAHAATPAHARWWIPPLSAQERANATWLRPVETLDTGSPPIRLHQRVGAMGTKVSRLLKRLN
jgi:hypothetical protein